MPFLKHTLFSKSFYANPGISLVVERRPFSRVINFPPFTLFFPREMALFRKPSRLAPHATPPPPGDPLHGDSPSDRTRQTPFFSNLQERSFPHNDFRTLLSVLKAAVLGSPSFFTSDPPLLAVIHRCPALYIESNFLLLPKSLWYAPSFFSSIGGTTPTL